MWNVWFHSHIICSNVQLPCLLLIRFLNIRKLSIHFLLIWQNSILFTLHNWIYLYLSDGLKFIPWSWESKEEKIISKKFFWLMLSLFKIGIWIGYAYYKTICPHPPDFHNFLRPWTWSWESKEEEEKILSKKLFHVT